MKTNQTKPVRTSMFSVRCSMLDVLHPPSSILVLLALFLLSAASAFFHLLPRRACLWAALGFTALLATGPQPARAAAVTEAWVQRYNGPANAWDIAQAVAVDGSGNVVVTGFSINPNVDYYTAKYAAANGALLWEKRYNGPANSYDLASAVAVDGSGNVVVTGNSGNGSNDDYYTAKYAAADGALLWEKRYNGPGNDDDNAQAVAVDGSGNVVVTGSSGTIKYLANGTAVWTNNASATALAVDGSGNVVVTGSSNNGAPNYDHDYYTAKYAAADGALLWERRYNGPANGDDYASSLALGPNGMVAITGASVGIPGFRTASYDYATVLYREILPPVITCPTNTVAHCSGGGGAVVNFTVTATDDSGVAPTMTCVPPSGSLFPIGQTTVTCTATDGDAASSTCSFTVTVVDTTPPSITCPSNLTVEFTSEAGAVVTYSVTAADVCDPDVVVTCVPPSGSTFPIGTTGVHCTARDASANSNSCSFTVTVLGARGTKQNVLAELIALRATVTDQDDGKKLDEAIEHLTKSLDSELWVDQTHLERKHGDKVFHEHKETVKKLCDLIKSHHSNIPDAVLQGFIDRIFRADRLLASVAMQEAIAAGASQKKIEHAQKHLAKGDAEAGDDKCNNGIEDYQHAWKHAVRAKVSPPIHLASGQMQLEILGEPGERFTIQASSNLVNWVTIGTRTANAEGVVTFEDADAGRYPVRYYRAVSQ